MGGMAGAVASVAGSAISAGAKKAGAVSAGNANAAENYVENQQQGFYKAQTDAYDKALDYYYSQEDKASKQRGLDNFRAFNTIGKEASSSRINPGIMPTAEDYGIIAPSGPVKIK